MANFDSSFYTAQVAALADMSQAPNLKQNGGSLFYLHAKVTLTGSTADADLLRLCYLPVGAKVVPCASSVQCSADPGTTLVLDIGTAADTDLFADGIILSAGGAVAFDSQVCLQAVTPAQMTASTLVYATIPTSGASTITNGTTLTFWIAYTLG